MSEVTDQLESQIAAGKIIFDSGGEAKLKRELLGENVGTQVTPKLQALVLALSELASSSIRISSLVRTNGHHGQGRAADIGNEEIAQALLPQVATDNQVAALEIDELIFDAGLIGAADRNQWNYDQGARHDYSERTLNQHRDHIHFSVTS